MRDLLEGPANPTWHAWELLHSLTRRGIHLAADGGKLRARTEDIAKMTQRDKALIARLRPALLAMVRGPAWDATHTDGKRRLYTCPTTGERFWIGPAPLSECAECGTDAMIMLRMDDETLLCSQCWQGPA